MKPNYTNLSQFKKSLKPGMRLVLTGYGRDMHSGYPGLVYKPGQIFSVHSDHFYIVRGADLDPAKKSRMDFPSSEEFSADPATDTVKLGKPGYEISYHFPGDEPFDTALQEKANEEYGAWYKEQQRLQGIRDSETKLRQQQNTQRLNDLESKATSVATKWLETAKHLIQPNEPERLLVIGEEAQDVPNCEAPIRRINLLMSTHGYLILITTYEHPDPARNHPTMGAEIPLDVKGLVQYWHHGGNREKEFALLDTFAEFQSPYPCLTAKLSRRQRISKKTITKGKINLSTPPDEEICKQKVIHGQITTEDGLTYNCKCRSSTDKKTSWLAILRQALEMPGALGLVPEASDDLWRVILLQRIETPKGSVEAGRTPLTAILTKTTQPPTAAKPQAQEKSGPPAQRQEDLFPMMEAKLA